MNLIGSDLANGDRRQATTVLHNSRKACRQLTIIKCSGNVRHLVGHSLFKITHPTPKVHTHVHTHLKAVLHEQYVGWESLYPSLLNSIATEHQRNVWRQCQEVPQVLQAHTLTALWIHSIHLFSILQPNQQAAQLWANVDVPETVKQCCLERCGHSCHHHHHFCGNCVLRGLGSKLVVHSRTDNNYHTCASVVKTQLTVNVTL
jgi:hypothetical protein